MSEYKPNSHRSKAEAAEKKKVEKVVSGKVHKKKKNRFADVFISEDAGNIKNYVFMDVLVPAIKKAVSDIVTDGVHMLMYGDTNRRGSGSSKTSYVSYRDYSSSRDERRPVSRGLYHYDEIIFESRGDADYVLDQMYEILDAYDTVSVADLYDLAGESCEHTANRYGWTNLRNADVVRVRDGYIIKLPKPGPIR